MELILTSPAVKDGDFLPDKFTGYGEDISPELHINGIDPKTVSMIILLDDTCHPWIKDYNHWIAWNVEPVSIIPEHLPKGDTLDHPIKMRQGRGYGKYVYKGPLTPKGHTNVYIYKVFTLDCELKAYKWVNKKKIMKLAEGHILQKAELHIKYRPK